jgi:O-antigen ligase
MTNPGNIIRSLIIYGLCIPLAIYLGYLLANPMDRVSMGFVVVALFLPLIPALLRWHHILLVASWNMGVVLFFIPGSPHLWIVMTAVSLGLTVLQHILKRNVQFASVPSVTWPLIFLAVVIFVTARLTGGFGLRSFGGESIGGKRYILLLGAIAGYFAMTSHRIPPGKGIKYVSLFFLGALTMIMASLGPWIPASLHFVFALFPVENLQGLTGETSGAQYTRLFGVTMAALGGLYFMLARHGMSGVFSFGERWHFMPLRFQGGLAVNQPWRLLFFLGVIVVSLMGGYRSYLITIGLVLMGLFHLEGLVKSRLMPALVLVGVLTLAIALPMAEKLPMAIQRSISFLPVKINPVVRADAEASSEWRVKIWEEVLPTVPQYLLVGKGYSIDAKELETAKDLEKFLGRSDGSVAAAASDFHNGPLSLIIPLGIFGAMGFLWFLAASFRVLLNNYRYGDAEYRTLNVFLLVYFVVRVGLFFIIFGSFHTELTVFAGLVGLSVAVNGGMRRPVPVMAPAPNPAYLPFRLPKAAKV